MMDKNSLEKKPIKFSPFMVGTMRLGKWGKNFNTSEWMDFVENCLALGLNDFDHADIYGDYTTEEDFGKVLKEKPHLRDQIQITTKCGIKMPAENRPSHQIKSYDSSKAHIIASVENSLSVLHTDYIDVLLLHRPDFLMNPAEIAETFTKLQQEGKVKHFGVSNFSTSQFEMIHQLFPLVTHQMEISLGHRNAFEDGALNQLMMKGITPTAWSPLCGGQFLNKGELGANNLEVVVNKLTKKYGLNSSQLLLAWLKKHPSGIIPVLGTSIISRLQEALAVQEIVLENEDWYALYTAAKREKLP